MGVSDESAILSKWLVQEGSRVRTGQALFALETDKATFQYESEADGVILHILVQEGDEAAVGSTVAILGGEGETVDEAEFKTEPVKASPCPNEPDPAVQPEPNTDHAPEAKNGLRISPRARKLAALNQLSISGLELLTGSGPEGRILEADVQTVLDTRKASRYEDSEQPEQRIPYGRPLTQADRVLIKQAAPRRLSPEIGMVSRTFNAAPILKRIGTAVHGIQLTAGDAIRWQLAGLLADRPELNARRHGDKIHGFKAVHLRLAVETEAGTLFPVLRCANEMTEFELAVMTRALTERCKSFASGPQEFCEGTFTVLDLCEYGVEDFTPPVVPPEICALGIGGVELRNEASLDGRMHVYPAIRLTLACDLAAVDINSAAKFLRDLAIRLESGAKQQQFERK